MAIYGNAIMTGAGGQGGGGEILPTDAILRVQAPAGSTVTITKGSTTKSDMGHENADDATVYDYYFIIHQSQFDSVTPWTVTATLGTQSKSDTVVIDMTDEYNIIISYQFYFIKDGHFVGTALTKTGASRANFTEGNQYLVWYGFGNAAGGAYGSADVTQYNTLKLEISEGWSWANANIPILAICNSQPSVDAGGGAVSGVTAKTTIRANTGILSSGTYTLDISGYTGTKYILLTCSGDSSNDGYMHINNLWLE